MKQIVHRGFFSNYYFIIKLLKSLHLLAKFTFAEVLSTAKQEASNAEKAEQQNDRNLQETNECNHSAK